MLGEEQILSTAEKTLRLVEADQAEVSIWSHTTALTRFAESCIHQNMTEENLRLVVRAVVDKKIGCAVTNRIDDESLREVAGRAATLARNSAANEKFHSLPSPKSIDKVEAFSAATAASSPEDRALAVKEIIEEAKPIKAIASGALSTTSGEFAVANSLGIGAVESSTRANLVVIIADGDASGYGEWEGRDIAELSPKSVAEAAAQKCAASRSTTNIEPGKYTVILEEPAVADLITFLAYIGLGATAFQEGRSFMCDQIEKKIAGGNITLWDDARNPRLLTTAFDCEGVPKEKVVLIEKGIAQGVVYDSYTAAKEGRQSTGHAMMSPNTFGPAPFHLCLAPGEADRQQMIASTGHGLLVTRFHYTNIVSPRETILTGMTRDGTFLIEDGKIRQPVQNLRFTESILGALSRVELVAAATKLSMSSLVPALKVSDFTFTS